MPTPTETVVQMNTLAALTVRIKADLVRREASKAEWVEATIDLCIALAAARDQFENDRLFGQWFDESGFALNHNDRAAAIAMGRDIEQARRVLELTERRSLQLICAHEMRFTSASNPPHSTGRDRQRRGRQRAAVDAARATVDRRAAAGEPLSRSAVAAETGVGEHSARIAIAQREAEQRILSMPLEEFRLSATAQQRYEALVRRHEREFEERVRQEARRQVEELRIPHFLQRLAEIERMITTPRNAVMSSAEYRKILFCLHRDQANNRSQEELDEATRIFKHYKMKLVNEREEREDELRRATSGMPRTVEEMLRRRDEVRAARAAARAARRQP